MSSKDDVEDDGNSCQEPIDASVSLSSLQSHGPDADNTAQTQKPPESSRHSSDNGCDDVFSVKPFEFDAVLVFADEDEQLADDIEERMNSLDLYEGEKAKVCKYKHPRFGASVVKRPQKLVEKCRLVFFVLSENTKSDDIMNFTKNEAISYAIYQKRQCVRYLHTQPKDQQSYLIAEGLTDVTSLTWFKPLEKSLKTIKELFCYNRENTRAANSHQDGQNSCVGGPSRHELLRNGNLRKTEGPNSTEESEQKSPDLKRITHDSNMMLQKWQQELFCKTRAVRKAKEVLKLKGSVFIVGRSGDGKTSSVYHILCDLKKEKSTFQSYIIKIPEDMDHLPQKDSIVFVDNIFGSSNFSSVLLEKWRVCFQRIEAYVDAGDMYFIASSPCHVRDDCVHQLSNIPLLSHIVNMADEYSLGVHEKDDMLTEYLESKCLQMSVEEKKEAVHSDLSLGFPQCCKLYVTNPEAQSKGSKFFQKPYIFLSEQIEKFSTSEMWTEKLNYIVLVLCFYQRGKFSSDALNPFSDRPMAMVMIQQVWGIQNTTIDEMRKASERLCSMGFLRYDKHEGAFEFSHQSIHDAVSLSFGKGKGCEKKFLELCPLDVLISNTAIVENRSDTRSSIVDIPPAFKKDLFDRITSELKNGEFKVFEHSCFAKKEVVKEIFEYTPFATVFKKVMVSPRDVMKLAWNKNLYYLTASKKYQSLVLQMIDAILELSPQENLKIPQSIPIDALREKEETFDLVLRLPLHVSVSVFEIYNDILHQCLEGSCIAGDLRIFQKLEHIKPCDNCFVKAIASNDDQPAILNRLLSNDSVTYIDVPLLIMSLVKMGKVKSLEEVFSLKKKTPFQEKKKVELFRVSCATGNYDVFQMLKEHISIPVKYHDDLLFESIAGTKIIQSLLTEENKNCLDGHGRTLLHHACLKKRPELCAFLISKGVDHSVEDKKGFTALHLACQHMDKKSVEDLILRGTEVTVTIMQVKGNLKGLSPLHMAARNDKGSSLVDLLIQEGPKGVDMVNCRDQKGKTPLHIAAQSCHGQSMIKELVKHKADLKTVDEDGKTPLHIAATANIPKNIESLLEHSVNVNAVDKEEMTPLHYVLARRISTRDEIDAQKDSVDQLLMKGADVTLVDKSGNSSVHIAAQFNTPSQVFQRVLSKAGDNIDLNKKGMSPLHLAFKPDVSRETVTSLMSKYPSLLQTKTSDGKSVLNVALEKCVPYCVAEVILDVDTSAAQTENWDDTSLDILQQYEPEQIIHILELCAYYFSSSKKFDMMELLSCRDLSDEDWLEAVHFLNVDTDFLSEKKRHSLIFKILDSPEKIKYVLSKGSSVNVVNHEENTPLHVAVSQGYEEGIKTLLTYEVDVNKVNTHGDTFLHIACRNSLLLSGKLHILKTCYFSHSLMYNFLAQLRNILKQILMTDTTIRSPMYLFTRKEKNDPFINILSVFLQQYPHLIDKVKICNKFGHYPVHYSVHDKHLLDQILSSEDDLMLKTQDGWSCLHFACLIGDNLEVIKHVLDKNISPCFRDKKGIAPLHVALICGMKDIATLKRLAMCSHESPCHDEVDVPFLHVAAAFCTKEIVKMFIELTPDMLFKEDKEGHLPLHYAVAGSDLEVIKLVTDAMKKAEGRVTSVINRDHKPRSIYEDTVRRKSQSDERSAEDTSTQKLKDKHDTKEIVLEIKGKQSPEDQDDHSGLVVATCDKQQPFRTEEYYTGDKGKTIEQLMKPWEGKSGSTVMHFAARYSSPEVLKFLLNNGFVVNKCDNNGNSPLHVAVACGRSGVVDCLLKAGAKTDTVNQEDLTPLLYGLMEDTSQPENLCKLLECGLFGKTCSKGGTNALHLLCKKRFNISFLRRHSKASVFTDPALCVMVKLLTILIEKGCDVNARDENGQTPLHMAAAADNDVYVDILLDHQAEIDAVDNEGRTPLHRAVGTRYSLSTAVCLVDRGANPYAVVRTGPIVVDILMDLNIFSPHFLLSTYVEELYQKLNILDEKKEFMNHYVSTLGGDILF